MRRLEKKTAEKGTKRLPEPSHVMTVSRESAPSKASGNAFDRFLDKLGFETDFGKKDRNKIPVKQLPRRAWNGVKSAASDTRDIWLNKSAAYDKPLFVIVIVVNPAETP